MSVVERLAKIPSAISRAHDAQKLAQLIAKHILEGRRASYPAVDRLLLLMRRLESAKHNPGSPISVHQATVEIIKVYPEAFACVRKLVDPDATASGATAGAYDGE